MPMAGSAAFAAAAPAGVVSAHPFASLFHEDGYFLDQSSGMRWSGDEVRQPVEAIVKAIPDMHRELLALYVAGDVVVVELRLQGTHQGDLHLAAGTIPATGRRMDAPCCDVFHLKDGKVTSFHCYNLPSVILQQLGVLGNLEAALRR